MGAASRPWVPGAFRSDIALSLLRSLFGAIRGHRVYRKSTFLLDQVGAQIFPDWEPSAKTRCCCAVRPVRRSTTRASPRAIANWSAQACCRLPARQLRGAQARPAEHGQRRRRAQCACIASSGESFDELLRKMDRGVLVTELMGQGTNMVTGDYSRGAAGFWVEGGEIQYPDRGDDRGRQPQGHVPPAGRGRQR